jgi:spectinomycin phosphotransferase
MPSSCPCGTPSPPADDEGNTEVTAPEQLCAWVRSDFDVDLTTIDRVAHGADENAEPWRGVCADGSAFAVKLSGGGAPAGLVVSAHLAAHDVLGVVAPVPTRYGQLWSEHEGRRLSVVPWVSDDRAIGGGMRAEHWSSFGALLATVHATAVTDRLAELLPRERHTHERLSSTVRALDSRLHALVEQPAGVVGAADPLRQALAKEWRASAGRLSTLLEGADRLSRELRTRHTPGVVCHGDPHLGNLLIGGDERVWLIDWDDAVLAPRERDLMFVIGGVLAFAPVSPQEQSWFFDGYGSADIDPARLAYYRCTRALEDLADPAAQILDVDRLTAPERADALSIVAGVLSTTGLASLALSSLRDLGLITDESPATGSDVSG